MRAWGPSRRREVVRTCGARNSRIARDEAEVEGRSIRCRDRRRDGTAGDDEHEDVDDDRRHEQTEGGSGVTIGCALVGTEALTLARTLLSAREEGGGSRPGPGPVSALPGGASRASSGTGLSDGRCPGSPLRPRRRSRRGQQRVTVFSCWSTQLAEQGTPPQRRDRGRGRPRARPTHPRPGSSMTC